jgi:cytochrome b involved in lipid metabolism
LSQVKASSTFAETATATGTCDSSSSNSNSRTVMSTSADDNSLWNRMFGSSSEAKKEEEVKPQEGNNDDSWDRAEDDVTTDETCHGGPGKRVVVRLEDALVKDLPVMSLKEVRKCTTSKKMLVTYEGIVYDVTQFVSEHPGGAELLKTAAGLDLEHFFANYTVHGRTAKAAEWLVPLAVGKLTPEEAIQARDSTTPQVHVERRHQLLNQQRRKIIVIASTLPFWMTLRSVIGWVGWVVPPLGRLLAWAVPVTVPGLTRGSEPLAIKADNDNNEGNDGPYKVAVIGGGIAGCGAAWALARSGFDVTLYEAREQISGNARTFSWDFSPFRGKGETVESCVSVTAWPPNFYKNYTCLLDHLEIETVHQPLSWFLNSKVPGYEGVLWEADPAIYPGSLRKVFKEDFEKYRKVVDFSRAVTKFFTLQWAPWHWNDSVSMYNTHQGLGLLNPLTTVPLYSLFKLIGGTDEFWNIVFTPQYTASFLVDELRPFPAVFGPLIEDQIPLNPSKDNSWQGSSKRSPNDCNITTCVTWKDAGCGIRQVFDLLVKDVTVKEQARVRQVQILPNGKKRVFDEFDSYIDVDRVIFACPSNAVGNIFKEHNKVLFANTILSTPVYADDHHPSTGHMHAVMHSDGSVIPQEYRDDCLKRASNYVEITKQQDGSINVENQYNFGVQTPGEKSTSLLFCSVLLSVGRNGKQLVNAGVLLALLQLMGIGVKNHCFLILALVLLLLPLPL